MNDVQKTYLGICRSLVKHQLDGALSPLDKWTDELSDPVAKDRVDSIRANYHLLTDYYLSGQDDPCRDDLLMHLTRDIFALADTLYRRLEPGFLDPNGYTDTPLAKGTDGESVPDVFNYFVHKRFDDSQRDLFLSLIDDPEMEDEALIAISGLCLQLTILFSVDGILCLMRAAEEQYPRLLRERAWVSLMLLLLQYDERLPFYPELQEALMDLISSDDGMVYAKTTLTCLVRTEGTEWAGKTYQEMQSRLMPLIDQAMKDDKQGGAVSLNSMEQIEAQLGESFHDILDDQRDDMLRIAEDRLDSQFAVFRNMYTAPFFAEPYRWWLPFAEFYLPEDLRPWAKMLPMLGPQALCDSDQYAFLSTFKSIGWINGKPASEISPDDLPQMAETGLVDDLLTDHYVKQAYRFFRLSPWKVDSPFHYVRAIYSSTLFRLICPTAQEKRVIARQALRCHADSVADFIYMKVASTLRMPEVYAEWGIVLMRLDNCSYAADQLKEGLSLARTEPLLRLYQQALVDSEQWEEALPVASELLALAPDNLDYRLRHARSLERNELYAEALQEYMRLDYLHPDDYQVELGVATCSSRCGDYPTAERYILRAHERPESGAIVFVRMAFIYLLEGKRADALLAMQHASINMSSADLNNAIDSELYGLQQQGISRHEVMMLYDLAVN